MTVRYEQQYLEQRARPAFEQPALPQPLPRGPGYVAGQAVEVYSETYRGWVAASIIEVGQEPPTVTVRYADGRLQKTLSAGGLALVRPVGGGLGSSGAPTSLPGSPSRRLTQVRAPPVALPPGPAPPDAVAFLDIDGVLHSLYGEELFAETCCAALERVLHGGGARAVLIGSWSREGADRAAIVDDMLRQRGLPVLGGQTQDLHGRTEAEICEWLDRHPEVLRWVVVDDTDLQVSDSQASRRLRGRCVRPDKHVGLTMHDAELAVAILLRGFSPGAAEAGGSSGGMVLLPDEQVRAARSRTAELETWEQLRNGDLAKMEASFFGPDT